MRRAAVNFAVTVAAVFVGLWLWTATAGLLLAGVIDNALDEARQPVAEATTDPAPAAPSCPPNPDPLDENINVRCFTENP